MSADTSKKKTAIKKLFIISPIGEPNSEDRIYFDKARRHIIDPVAVEKNYETKRADNISKPGRITKQIIERLRNDDLVVADLTRKNPNVFYELAVRHAVGRPVILMATFGEKIPFDVAAQRVIFYDLDPDNIAAAKEEMERQISEVESAKFIVDSPIEATISIKHLEKGNNQDLQEITAILRNQSARLRNIEENLLKESSIKGYREQQRESLRDTMIFENYLKALNVTEKLGYKLVLSDWSRDFSDPRNTSLELIDTIENFLELARQLKKKPTIHHEYKGKALWFFEPEERKGFRKANVLDFNVVS